MAERNSSTTSTSPKSTRSISPLSTSPKKVLRNGGQFHTLKHKNVERGGHAKKPQGLVTTDKPQVLQKPHVKEQTKPMDIKLHTQQRATRRAGYNDLVANKLYSLELLKKFEEKIQKVIEEEEIKQMRKEMVPKAQLMPLFDRPFCPQRSRRPLTVPKEPRVLRRNCLGENDPYRLFQQSLMKAIN